MALVPTTSIPLGFKAPSFSLPNVVSEEIFHLEENVPQKAVVMMFICNHCPYVKHVIDELIRLGNDYVNKNISFIAISSNDVVNYPEDAPDKMKEWALRLNFPFPYLYDESQEVAKSYFAACTPDFAIFNSALKCVYRGQLDDSRPGNNISPDGKDIRQVLNCILSEKPISNEQKPSIGCSIKWK